MDPIEEPSGEDSEEEEPPMMDVQLEVSYSTATLNCQYFNVLYLRITWTPLRSPAGRRVRRRSLQ